MADTVMQMYSERSSYMRYRDTSIFDEEDLYVFCDELLDFTFVPYSGKLKEIPGYEVIKDQIMRVHIFIYDHIYDKLRQIPCDIVFEQKRIYILEYCFNMNWKFIRGRLRAAVEQQHSNTIFINVSADYMVDLSLVTTPSRRAIINERHQIEYKGIEPDLEERRIISKCQNAISNHQIKYVYSSLNRLVHDKYCECVKEIDYCNMNFAKELPADREICPCCRREILIRSAIGTDGKHFGWYVRMFKKGNVSTSKLELFILQKKPLLQMLSLDVMKVICGEDTWKIELKQDGKFVLWHNNYTMINKLERCITSGFHLQKGQTSSLSAILKYIGEYTWQKHLEGKGLVNVYKNLDIKESGEEQEPQKQVDVTSEVLEKATSKRSVFGALERLVAWLKKWRD